MVAMWGTYGYEMDLNNMTEEDFAQTVQDVRYVKAHRDTLLYGDLHRLSSPCESDLAAWMTVGQGEAVVTAVRLYARPNARRQRLLLKGLQEKSDYLVEELRLTLSGAELMRYGLPLDFPAGDYQSLRFTLTKQ